MSRKTMERFESLNELIDEVVPHLTNAEALLLLYYWRHAKMVGQGEFRRNAFRISDGRAAKDLAKAKQTIQKQRISLMKKQLVRRIDRERRLPIWIIDHSAPQQGDSASESNRQRQWVHIHNITVRSAGYAANLPD